MQLNDYQERAASFKANDLPHREALTVWALGIAGEGGEVADIIKKHIGHGHPLDEKLAEELGDVLWYVAVLAAELNTDLDAIARHNLQKLYQRYPDGFSTEASLNRKPF